MIESSGLSGVNPGRGMSNMSSTGEAARLSSAVPAEAAAAPSAPATAAMPAAPAVAAGAVKPAGLLGRLARQVEPPAVAPVVPASAEIAGSRDLQQVFARISAQPTPAAPAGAGHPDSLFRRLSRL